MSNFDEHQLRLDVDQYHYTQCLGQSNIFDYLDPHGEVGSSLDNTGSSQHRPEKPVTAVDIRKRAEFLLPAIKEYSTASGRQGLINAIISGHPVLSRKYGEDSVDRFISQVNRHKSLGRVAFRNAYDTRLMVEAGLEPLKAEEYEESDLYEFQKALIGPGKDEEGSKKKQRSRDKLRKILEKQLK